MMKADANENDKVEYDNASSGMKNNTNTVRTVQSPADDNNNPRRKDNREHSAVNDLKNTRKCEFFESNGWCRFGESCCYLHPKIQCSEFSKNNFCKSGLGCSGLHLQKDCQFWSRGFCRKTKETCKDKHDLN